MMWYYRRGEAQLGPVSWEEIVGAGRTGGLTSGDLVWTDGMDQWQPASTIPGLLPQPVPGAALPVPPPYAGPRPPARPALGDESCTGWGGPGSGS